MAKLRSENSEDSKGQDEARRRIENCRKERPSVLKLDGLELLTVPPEIGQLTALTDLNLSHNRLNALPPEFGQLTALTDLDLSHNQLSALPPEIGQLTTLNFLELSQNQLSELPPVIGQLTELILLSASDNQLSALPPAIGQLTALRGLYLDGNKLIVLPKEIGQLVALNSFFVFSNLLVTLPPEIGRLTALSLLGLSDNQLGALPAEICQLEALTRLTLSDNPLGMLPMEIGRLARLEILGLQRTELRELPESLLKLSALQKLELVGNEALGLPPELLAPKGDQPANPRAILDYYFSRKAEGEEPMQEVRLLLVGRGRAGKTSLLKALSGKTPDEKEPETPGIVVEQLDMRCPRGTATGHVWDFGGQEFLHGTHQIFLAERCIYLLVLEGRESNWETETDYWLRFIQSFGGESPIVVVLTKYDAHPFSVDRFRLQERCPQIAGFVETDAFTGRGITELTDLLANTVNGMNDVWLGVPKKWHRVKQRLTSMPQSFLEYGDYRTLCKEMGIDDAEKQDSLAQTLHRLGVALNFRDHHRLRGTSVLKPAWVTEAIYGLLRYVQKKDCHGVMQQPWMEQALNPVDYPTEKHSFVLELMESSRSPFRWRALRTG